MPAIPTPLQRLFDIFPLRTYPANTLPARSPQPNTLPTHHVFISDKDAVQGRPSFNPSCLKWQTYLLLNNIPFVLSPSTNHASPTGSLPFLSPPTTTPLSSPRPIASSGFDEYVAQQTKQPLPPPSPREEAYSSLLAPIRTAWLHALYLNLANAPLLEQLYIDPTSTSRLVRLSILHSLRSAAEAEILKSVTPTTGTQGWRVQVGDTILSPDMFRPSRIEPEQIYRDAGEAFDALSRLLGESETGWFFGREKAAEFDAAVFAYTCLVMAEQQGLGGLNWRDGAVLGGLVEGAGEGELVRHRARIWEICFAGKKE
jgi:metaxin